MEFHDGVVAGRFYAKSRRFSLSPWYPSAEGRCIDNYLCHTPYRPCCFFCKAFLVLNPLRSTLVDKTKILFPVDRDRLFLSAKPYSTRVHTAVRERHTTVETDSSRQERKVS